MKIKVSISLDKNTVKKVDSKVGEDIFRNRSHFIEYAIKKELGD